MRTQTTLLAFALLALTGCSPTVATHGNMISKSALAEIQPEVSTRADVSTLWGPPTTVPAFDPNTWYYVGETTSQKGIFEPKTDNRQIVKVTFGPDDIVTSLGIVDPKLAQNIEPVDRKTLTAGKEFTAFQQFIGNLGKYNPPVKDSR